MGAEVMGRLKLHPYAVEAGAFFQSREFFLRVFVRLNHPPGHQMIVVHRKDENGNATCDGVVELQFGDGDGVPCWHVAITPGIDTEVNVCLVYHLQRDANGARVRRWKMLHGEWANALAQAGLYRFLAVLRQID
jgi:hypothetical protein